MKLHIRPLFLLVFAVVASFHSVTAAQAPPTPVFNNSVCSDIDGIWLELDISDVKNGTVTNGTLIITISNVVIDPVSNQAVMFDWSSNLPIPGIIVRGGQNGDNYYQYDPPATSGTGLAPDNQGSNVSEGLFCYEPPSSTPPPDGSGTPPTDEPTVAPTDAPTDEPTDAPTDAPTDEPTDAPTDAPTDEPTDAPTDAPTDPPPPSVCEFHPDLCAPAPPPDIATPPPDGSGTPPPHDIATPPPHDIGGN